VLKQIKSYTRTLPLPHPKSQNKSKCEQAYEQETKHWFTGCRIFNYVLVNAGRHMPKCLECKLGWNMKDRVNGYCDNGNGAYAEIESITPETKPGEKFNVRKCLNREQTTMTVKPSHGEECFNLSVGKKISGNFAEIKAWMQDYIATVAGMEHDSRYFTR